VRLVFLILVHKNPQQVQKLVDYLLQNNCDVFIHIDSKEKNNFKNFIAANSNREQLYIYSEYKVYWGSFNQIKATFFLLRESLKYSKFDFVSLISGQDLPVKPLSLFKEYLSQNLDKSFLMVSKIPEQTSWEGNGGLDRTELYWIMNFHPRLGFIFNRLNVIIHLLQNKLNLRKKAKLNLYGGANWFTLNRKASEYASNQFWNYKIWQNIFQYSRLADEVVLQTILMNSQYKNMLVNDCLRFIDWQNGPEFPRTFRKEDAQRLFESEAFFARKFDEAVDYDIIKIIYKNI